MAFTPQCSPATTHYFSGEYYQVLIATHPRRDGRLSWPEHHECKKVAQGNLLLNSGLGGTRTRDL